MESKSLSNVKDLYYTQKNLVKGEEYFTTSKSVMIFMHLIYFILVGIIAYSYYSKGISLTTYSTHLLVLIVCAVVFYLIISIVLYGSCIAIHRGKIKEWSGFYSCTEYDIKRIKSVYAVTIDTDDKGIYIVNKDDSVEKISTALYDKKRVQKILGKIEMAIEEELPKSVAEEIEVQTIKPTKKQLLGELLIFPLLTVVMYGIFGAILFGLAYLIKNYNSDVVLYVYNTFGLDVSQYLTPKNVYYAIIFIFGLVVLIQKNKAKKAKKEAEEN